MFVGFIIMFLSTLSKCIFCVYVLLKLLFHFLFSPSEEGLTSVYTTAKPNSSDFSTITDSQEGGGVIK